MPARRKEHPQALTILSVAYPLAPVGPDAAGGAEQVLHHLDRALVAAGHRSLVVAQAGSQVAGTLIPVPVEKGALERARERAWEHHRSAIAAALARYPVDLVHLHGVDFCHYLPPPPVPVLATLHLPVSWYPANALSPGRPNFWVHAVSAAQHAACPALPNLLPPIENGVPVDELGRPHARRAFALFLGRICPEKGVHLAIESAKAADIPLLIAGAVFPYEAHRRYFDEEVAPRLDAKRRFIGPVGFLRKRRLLAAARCLLVPSLAPETSSLVAREAIASGTPVIAFAAGALPEAVKHGRTGFIVDSLEGMAAAIRRTGEIDPALCRAVAAARFSLSRMTERYLDRYAHLAGRAGLLGAA